jgi:hypothetical protein
MKLPSSFLRLKVAIHIKIANRNMTLARPVSVRVR